MKGCDVLGVFWGEEVKRNPDRHAAAVADLLGFYAAGLIKPRVSQTYPLVDAAQALVALGTRKTTGKLVVTVP